MRLVSFEYGGRKSFGLVSEDGTIRPADDGSGRCADLREFLGTPPRAWDGCFREGLGIALEALRFMPVIPNPTKIVCVGLNYREHVGETGRQMSQYPVLFLRLPASQVGHLQPLVRPSVSEQLDYEGELAVIIGRAGRHIPRTRAFEHVAGYSIYNEASVRDWQKHTHQFTAGKNFTATGAFGPWLVTRDEIPDPGELTLTTRLNGKVVQHASVSQLIFPIDELIAYISTITELVPGDVLVTGTPGGVGGTRTPPLWMRPGDVVEVEIPRIGVLRNPIIPESTPPQPL